MNPTVRSLATLLGRAARDGVHAQAATLDALRRDLARRAATTRHVEFRLPASTATGWLAADLTLAEAIDESQR